MTKRLVLSVVVLAVIVALVFFLVGRGRQAPPTPTTPADTRGAGASNETAAQRVPVDLDTRRQQLIGVRMVTVQHAALNISLRLAGTVAVDETRQSEISTRVDGWIRELMADFTGRVIRRGDPLFTFYSPELIATEQELLLALRGRNATAAADVMGGDYSERLVAAARERLLRLEMAPEDVERVERTGQAVETTTFRSPVAGTIIEKTAVRGMRVMAGATLFRIADLSSIWVEAEVYETDLAAVRPGISAAVTLESYPDRTFAGRVSFVAPTVTADTRTARIRIALANPAGMLKPNMLAQVIIQLPETHALVVPPDAIVSTGTESLAFVAEGNGRFAPRRVSIGRRTSDAVEILSGLNEGEAVAASATFFLDSESQLRGALQNYEPTANMPLPAGQTASTLEATFRTEPEAPRPGDVSVFVTISDGGQPVADAEVAVILSMPAMPAMGMPAMRSETKLIPVGGGTYRGTAQLLSAGRWDVAVTIGRPGQPPTTRQFSLMVR